MSQLDIWKSHPLKNSKGGRRCRVCANHQGLIRKCDIMMCRQCFRERAAVMGFVKVN